MAHGPITSTLFLFEDFLTYKSGVYTYVSGEPIGGHSIKIIGWGVEDGLPYWLVVNSWNEDWGENGYVKILRGKNEIDIEGEAMAGLPIIKQQVEEE